MNRATEEGRAGFETLVGQIMEHYDAAGMAVAVIDDKETLYQQFFGYRDVEEQVELNENTIMGMASISKSFTALAIMQLAEKSVIDLDAPLTRYLPEFRNAHQPQQVKVYHLLSHAGGFLPQRRMLVEEVARELDIWQEGKVELGPHAGLAQRGTELVCQRLDAQTRHTGKPGEYMSYSNDSYGLLSEIIRRYGGEDSFADYVEKHIFRPLEMHRSTALFIQPAQDPNCTKLYYHKEGKRQWCRDFYDNAFVLMGGGAVKSTLADMKQYLRMYLRGGVGPRGNRVLSEYGIREMGKPRQQYRFQEQYGYGLSVQQLDEITVIGHGGSMTGISTSSLGRLSWAWALWCCATPPACRHPWWRKRRCAGSTASRCPRHAPSGRMPVGATARSRRPAACTIPTRGRTSNCLTMAARSGCGWQASPKAASPFTTTPF